MMMMMMMTEIMLSLPRLERQLKDFSKYISKSHVTLSFLLNWNWNDEYIHTLP